MTLKQSCRAIVFDLDGTLIDSYDAIASSVNHVRAHWGMPPLSVADVRRFVGRGAELLLLDTVDRGTVAENVQLYKDHHATVMIPLTRVLPEVPETLEKLYAHGIILAVCSNKPVAFSRELLDYLDLSRFVRAIVGPENAPRPKPAPDMLNEVVRQLELPLREVLYVGDMVIDILTGRSAGVAVWAVPTGSEDVQKLIEARPDRLLRSFGELAELASPAG